MPGLETLDSRCPPKHLCTLARGPGSVPTQRAGQATEAALGLAVGEAAGRHGAVPGSTPQLQGEADDRPSLWSPSLHPGACFWSHLSERPQGLRGLVPGGPQVPQHHANGILQSMPTAPCMPPCGLALSQGRVGRVAPSARSCPTSEPGVPKRTLLELSGDRQVCAELTAVGERKGMGQSWARRWRSWLLHLALDC